MIRQIDFCNPIHITSTPHANTINQPNHFFICIGLQHCEFKLSGSGTTKWTCCLVSPHPRCKSFAVEQAIQEWCNPPPLPYIYTLLKHMLSRPCSQKMQYLMQTSLIHNMCCYIQMHTCNICHLWQALLVCKHDNYPFWLKLVDFISIFCFSVLLLTAVIPCQALNLL